MAIAYSATSEGYANTGTTATFAHTISGSNNVLFVGGWTNSSTATVSSVTYNGDAMTQIGTTQAAQSNAKNHMFGIVNPDAGTNNVVVTVSANIYHTWVSTSYTGASQSGVPTTVAEGNTTGVTSYERTVNTVTSNNMVVGSWLTVGGSSHTGTTGTTIRNTDWQNQHHMIDEGTNASGNVTIGMSWTGSDNVAGIACELIEASSTSIKTINGLAIASVKTVNGLPIASVKTVNGLA